LSDQTIPPEKRVDGSNQASSLPLPNRARILALVREHPGVCVEDIAKTLGISRTGVEYHVRVLARDRLLSHVRHGRRLRMFPPDLHRTVQRNLLGQLRLPVARSLLLDLREHPTESWRFFARRLGISSRTVRWHVTRLQTEGIIRVTHDDWRRHVVEFHEEVREYFAASASQVPARAWVDASGPIGAAPRPDASSIPLRAVSGPADPPLGKTSLDTL